MQSKSVNYRSPLMLVALYWVVLWVYAIWSYALIDPNLTLISHPLFLGYLDWTKAIFLGNRQLLSFAYVAIVSLSTLLYLRISWQVRSTSIEFNSRKLHLVIGAFFLFTLPLLFSYNALSHDVFNYIFNARMVIEYGADPHVQVALDFAGDDWTRFMHNTHTAAPYWYGWTGLSLIPYFMGLGKFFSTWILFKVFSAISLGLVLLLSLATLVDNKTGRVPIGPIALLVFNPLVLFEIVGNAHNDLWMMLPVLLSSWLLLKSKRFSWRKTAGAIALFAVSVSTKYATIVLFPVWILLLLKPLVDQYLASHTKRHPLVALSLAHLPTIHFSQFSAAVFVLMSVSMFSLLLFERSRWFLPWYLTWAIVFLPFMRATLQPLSHQLSRSDTWGRLLDFVKRFRWFWTVWLIGLSFGALLRYIPWLLTGDYSKTILTQQIAITWIGGIVISFILGFVLVTIERVKAKI